MARYLKRLGFKEVLTARDGQEAFDQIQSRSIDLLVTDVRMPVMDGIGLVRNIAGLEQAPPIVVFVSGFGDVDKEEMYALGVVAFMSKPCSMVDITSALKNAVADRSTQWKKPMPEVPRQVMTYTSKTAYSHTGQDVRLGRGGFCAPYVGPFSHGKVAFRCETHTPGRTLSGEGDIRWVSRVHGRIGIEFVYLDESCRSWVLDEIAAVGPRSFIPRS